MTTTHPKSYEELTRRVDEVLHYVWDPIGVSPDPEARDEYSSYVPSVISRLLSGEDANKIGLYLDQLAVEQMELPSNLEHSIQVATTLIEWKELLSGRHA
ncbi:MAG: hypothetical protein IPL96_04040 [Holophagaceae bacterium]|nr:hypothetical protein [Holophagaceae bacterium]